MMPQRIVAVAVELPVSDQACVEVIADATTCRAGLLCRARIAARTAIQAVRTQVDPSGAALGDLRRSIDVVSIDVVDTHRQKMRSQAERRRAGQPVALWNRDARSSRG